MLQCTQGVETYSKLIIIIKSQTQFARVTPGFALKKSCRNALTFFGAAFQQISRTFNFFGGCLFKFFLRAIFSAHRGYKILQNQKLHENRKR